MLEQLFTKQDIYYILIPLLIPLVSFFLNVIKSILPSYEYRARFWKCDRIPSSQNQYFRFLIEDLMAGFFFLFVFCVLYLIIQSIFVYPFGWEINDPCWMAVINKIRGLYLFLIYLLLAIKIQRNTILEFNKRVHSLKKRKVLQYILIKGPVITNGILWGCFLTTHHMGIYLFCTISYICYIIANCVLLSDQPHNEYTHVRFHFRDNTTLCNIRVENVRCRAKWIIVKNEDLQKEYRFQITDVKQVEYYNI